MSIRNFVENNYFHYNARVVKQAAREYVSHIDSGKKMLVTLAGAMSTAQLGKTLAEMIRSDKVHFISCTGANLEEDVMNLMGRSSYVDVDNYRTLKPGEEEDLLQNGYNRVTDTCIPETVINKLKEKIVPVWEQHSLSGERLFPHEYLYKILLDGTISAEDYDADPKDSWLLAAAEKNIPMVVPGWEDSSLGNIFVAEILEGNEKLDFAVVKSGLEYLKYITEWYEKETVGKAGVGFFQIGGGIAGDFPICCAPLLTQDMGRSDVPRWSYFCQISDCTTSYGSYSGAHPNEKITWGKLETDTPSFMIESDASIVAPLIFSYVLDI